MQKFVVYRRAGGGGLVFAGIVQLCVQLGLIASN